MAASDVRPDEAPAAAGAAASVGGLLRQLRESRGLTQEAVSLETRIPVASIRKIEENRFGELPGEVFVRGFLRAYARAVGADPARVLAVYDDQRGPAEPQKTSRWPGLFRVQRPRRAGLVLAVLAFLVILGLLFAFVYRGPEEPAKPGSPGAGPGPDAGAVEDGDAR
ncbi:MAG: helix-turn-helix domain-containing protein [Myxococcales bacterium]|nr:helix-turn-helix domain-containing protein [Myxococcales bacterium]